MGQDLILWNTLKQPTVKKTTCQESESVHVSTYCKLIGWMESWKVGRGFLLNVMASHTNLPASWTKNLKAGKLRHLGMLEALKSGKLDLGFRRNEIQRDIRFIHMLDKIEAPFSFHACLLHLISSSTSFFSISCAVTFSEWEWKRHSENQELKQLEVTISWCVTNRRAEHV